MYSQYINQYALKKRLTKTCPILKESSCMTEALIHVLPDMIEQELNLIWAAHKAVGLSGYMCLYTNDDQLPFRSKEAGIRFWFTEGDTSEVIAQVLHHYNGGRLANSPLLLNPIVHEKDAEGNYNAKGSGIIWCTGLTLGVERLSPFPGERLSEIGVLQGVFTRGDLPNAGLKALAFVSTVAAPSGDGLTVQGCRALYELCDMTSDQYAPYYFLSGIAYLTNNGIFHHDELSEIVPVASAADAKSAADYVKKHTITVQSALDAAECWNAYERHHSLYQKFGTDTRKIETNLRFFNLVARDVRLFDATGPQRAGAESTFEFIVPGLIPRGAITLIGATGGTGKSSVAHQLCVLASIDYAKDEEPPTWLGQPLRTDRCDGICVYFSGEDGPPIINARAALFDPEGRAQRLMFQRTDFGEGVTFSQHMRRLHKIPNVPIIVIDPARKYLTGDENDAGVVSEFFEAIEEFAIEKNAAVVVVHHLQKGAKPNSASEVLDMLRGSQVFIDRPRVVIGMYRDGPYTIAGLAKNNIPPNLGMIQGERVFARDPKRLSLVWLPGEEGVRNAPLSEEELEEIANRAREESENKQ
jgi:hypothetical protein